MGHKNWHLALEMESQRLNSVVEKEKNMSPAEIYLLTMLTSEQCVKYVQSLTKTPEGHRYRSSLYC